MCEACIVGYGKDVNNACVPCTSKGTITALACAGALETAAVVAIMVRTSMATSTFRLDRARASNNIKVCLDGNVENSDV